MVYHPLLSPPNKRPRAYRGAVNNVVMKRAKLDPDLALDFLALIVVCDFARGEVAAVDVVLAVFGCPVEGDHASSLFHDVFLLGPLVQNGSLAGGNSEM
jgi:hypothetical protein